MQTPILKSTYKILTERVDELKKEIDANSKEIGRAAALGDLRENSAYHSARERQVLLLERMQRFKTYLGGKVVDLNGSKPERVSFGTAVTVVDVKSAASHLFNIIGPVEYELEQMTDMVTIGSPMARALIGKRVGDNIEFNFGAPAWSGVIKEIAAIK
jgi:transcription elongation factor GreA